MKRSALFYLHQRSGASFVEHQGWELPAFFVSPEQDAAQVRESVGLSDLSHYLKFDLKAQPEQHRWRLAKDHFLVFAEPPLTPPGGATDVTSVYASLCLIGPRSKDVLGKLTSLNLHDPVFPNLSCSQASVAHVHGILLREDMGSLPAFHLLVSREYAESVWETIVHAGHEFHLAPVGLEALRLLRD